uniref:Retrovirus-related Pol polyprotein from transposon TNT 1-94 n=1 Tax=Tanacetum cinerariifolium TaxID=118510 RepID=A0A6L2KFW8_TANCI|nr:hypothetical protein [Tanacetum cinerariifolium]
MSSLRYGNARNLNRVENIQTDNTNNTGTTNVTQNVVTEDLPQLLDFRGGSHVTNVSPFDVGGFSSWKDKFLVYLDDLEPYLLEILENRPFVPKSPTCTSENVLIKPQKQWSLEDRRLANQDKRLKTIIISCLSNDVMRLKILLNDLETKGVSIPHDEMLRKTQREAVNSWLISMLSFMTKLSLQTRRGKYKALKAELALLTKTIDVVSKNKSEKGLVVKSFDCDEESLSSEDEGVTRVKAFMAIVEDEPAMGKTDARSGQWMKITMKKVHRLMSMTDGDERKHVLDYTNVDLHYEEDQRKKFLSGRGKRKETIFSKEIVKEIVFTKEEKYPSETIHAVTSDTEPKCDVPEPLHSLLKLVGAEPIGTSNDVITPAKKPLLLSL